MSAAGCHNVCLKAEAEIWSPLLPRHTGASSKFCWKHKQPFSRELGSFCPLPPPDSQSLPLWERFGVGSLLFSYTTGVSEHCFIEVSGNWKIFHIVWRTDALGETESKACPGTWGSLCLWSVALTAHKLYTWLPGTEPPWGCFSISCQNGKQGIAPWRLPGIC